MTACKPDESRASAAASRSTPFLAASAPYSTQPLRASVETPSSCATGGSGNQKAGAPDERFQRRTAMSSSAKIPRASLRERHFLTARSSSHAFTAARGGSEVPYVHG